MIQSNPLLPKDHNLYPWIILLFTLLSTNMVMIIAVGVQIAQPAIQSYYVLGNTESSLIATSLLVMLAAAVPFTKMCSERFGYMRMFLFSNILLTISCLGVAVSSSYSVFLFFRACNGVASGFIMPMCITILAMNFPRVWQPLAFSLYTAFGFGFGYMVASLSSGYFAEMLEWQYIFLLPVLIGVLLCIAIYYLMHETPTQPLGTIDWIGYISFFVFTVALVFFLIHIKAPWNGSGIRNNLIIFLSILIVSSLVIFIVIERSIPTPIFLLHLFGIRAFTLGSIAAFFIGAILFGTSSMYSMAFYDDYRWPFHQIGNQLIPFGISIGIFGAITGFCSEKIGVRIPTFVGLSLISISCIMNHSFTIITDHFDFTLVLLIRGAGIGIALGPVTALSLRRVDPADVGIASVMVTMIRQLGSSFGGLIMKVIVDIRFDVHTERFGEQMASITPAYDQTLRHLTFFFSKQLGCDSVIAVEKAKASIGLYAKKQAHILAVNDAFLIFGILLGIVTLILTFFMIQAYLKRTQQLESRYVKN